jgi:hypothetical protein
MTKLDDLEAKLRPGAMPQSELIGVCVVSLNELRSLVATARAAHRFALAAAADFVPGTMFTDWDHLLEALAPLISPFAPCPASGQSESEDTKPAPEAGLPDLSGRQP